MPSTHSSAPQPEPTTLILSRDIHLPTSAQMDQMELDLKRLREDSERLSASIKQLEAQDLDGVHAHWLSNDSWFGGVQGLALCTTLLLVLAWLAWRMLAARKHMRPQDFVNRALYPSPQPTSVEDSHKALKAVELRSSVWLEDPQDEGSALADEVSTPHGRQGFDFEAAASEVERVRKSLAQKRAQREQLRHAPPAPIFSPDPIVTPHTAPLELVVPHEVHPASAPTLAAVVLDSDLEFEFDPVPDIAIPPAQPTEPDTPTIQVEQVVMTDPEVETAPVAVTEAAVEVGDEPVAEDDENDELADALAVKLALAQELYALGLSTQARELAQEVVESERADLTESARELIWRCDAQALKFERQQQEYAGLLDSLRDVGVSGGS